MESVLENIGDSPVYGKFCEIIFPYRSILESHPSEHLAPADENGLNGNQISDVRLSILSLVSLGRVEGGRL